LHYSTFKISTMTVVFDFPSKYWRRGECNWLTKI
jgi:hypothetical protein